MDWLKLAGILLIVWIPTAAGFHRAHWWQESATRRRELVAALEELARAVCLTRRAPAQALVVMAQSGRWFFLSTDDRPANVVDNMLSRLSQSLRDEPLSERLHALFDTLASSDAVGAESALNDVIRFVADAAESAESVSRQRAPLCRKIGALSSLFLLILLL